MYAIVFVGVTLDVVVTWSVAGAFGEVGVSGDLGSRKPFGSSLKSESLYLGLTSHELKPSIVVLTFGFGFHLGLHLVQMVVHSYYDA